MSARPLVSTAVLLAKHAGSDNAWTVNFAESKVGGSGVACRTEAGTNSPTITQPDRLCEVCGKPLAKRWQRRACSYRCAGALTPIRPQAGVANGNWRGGRSKRPAESYVKPWQAKNPEKVAAQHAVAKAIRQGVLTRPTVCDSCLMSCKPDAHHWNYANPLSVEWLCRKCHVAADKLRAAREARQSRAAQAQQAQGHRHIANTRLETNGERQFAGRGCGARRDREARANQTIAMRKVG